jgi:2-polyprenyl-3-methyl-5-hydroxy-6-metoxy-1,4-benzoquinol methylase
VYDIGSFPGYGMWAFRNCRRYIGVGKCPEWFRFAVAQYDQVDWLDWEIESLTSPPPAPELPQVLILQEVLEHIRRPKRLLTSLYEFMPDGSHLYLTTNNLNYLGYILKLAAGKEIFDSAMTEDTVYPGHCTYYSLLGLKTLLTELGFRVVSARRINFLPSVRYYRRRVSALFKNIVIKSAPNRYYTHLEVLCQK